MHDTIGIVYHHREVGRMRAFCGVETDKGSWARLGIKFLSTRVPVAAGQNISLLACRSKASKAKYSRTHFCLKKYSQPVKQTKKSEQSCGIKYLVIFSIRLIVAKIKDAETDANFGIWNIAASEILTWNVCKKRNIMFQRQNPECFQPLNVCIQRRWESWRYFPAKGISPKQNFFWIFCNILLTFYLSQTNDNNKKQKLDGY